MRHGQIPIFLPKTGTRDGSTRIPANDFFERFGIDYIIVFNRSDQIVFAKGYNLSSLQPEEIPETLADEIRDLNSASGILASTEGSAGILDSRDGPVSDSVPPDPV